MVPMYRESAVLGQMIDGLTQMEYPPTRMEVLLLLEEDDVETREACQALELPAGFRVVVVPPGRPRTKPRACNYGLALCRGDVVVIYDAEDQPERDQFLIAAQALRDEPANVACVQARLAYYNPRQNLLTRWFVTEYLSWFGIMLPGMHGIGAPIPLGGTSNFFRTEALRSVGGWDSWNVAEDCDLGMRLYRFGYRVQIIDSTTWEEACPEVGLWIRQRSRWAKGYMQTWLVHNRRPGRLWHDMGPWRFFNMQIVIGASVLCLLLNPIYWGLTALWWIHPTHLEQSVVGFGPSLIVGNLCFWAGNSIFILFHCIGAVRARAWDLALFGLFVPLYWVLMSIAAWKALWQILVAPHFWEKTRHGLAKKRGTQAS
jgi:cellulose synthase/poly-beta-1,6-N-acetylglucosamine synthase-like glycosyltransferase